MPDDPYKILGVSRDADQDAIRKAYRRLAKENHPDLHPGDKAAEERFKHIGVANSILGDPERRARFDRGEIDAGGQERPQPPPGYRAHAEGASGARYSRAGFGGGAWDQEDLGDIFGDIFGGGAQSRGRSRARPSGPRRGDDHSYTLSVSFVDAALGATRRLTLPNGSVLDVKVPPGLEDGQTLRLRGKGGEGYENGPAGDALIRVSVAEDPRFERDGDDIRTEAFVSLRDAVLGGRIQVETPAGPVSLTVPPDSDTGSVLRLRGRGIAAHEGREAGSLFVQLKVRIGTADPALKAFLRGDATAPENAA
ncbi:J domain-containing protein [Acetobacteraceae bacterium KSS8]|uniref:J domain-containing protein n=1 Tax=Endosaccharibacter trunci TaxID=2812733 RepID=A0ABT1W2L9_9PROT|nr:J domain-containing protein [Acetobacteraceae bacterium KSS8]